MKRWFAGIVALDTTMLVLPTGWLGARTEFWLALTLTVATGLAWCFLRATQEER